MQGSWSLRRNLEISSSPFEIAQIISLIAQVCNANNSEPLPRINERMVARMRVLTSACEGQQTIFAPKSRLREI